MKVEMAPTASACGRVSSVIAISMNGRFMDMLLSMPGRLSFMRAAIMAMQSRAMKAVFSDGSSRFSANAETLSAVSATVATNHLAAFGMLAMFASLPVAPNGDAGGFRGVLLGGSPNHAGAPNDAQALAGSAAAPEDRAAPGHGVAPDHGAAPYHRVAPDQRHTPDHGCTVDQGGGTRE